MSVAGIAAQFTRTIRGVRARAQLVETRGEEFLAGAGLAQQQHRGIGRRDVLELLQHPPQRRAPADDGRCADRVDSRPAGARRSDDAIRDARSSDFPKPSYLRRTHTCHPNRASTYPLLCRSPFGGIAFRAIGVPASFACAAGVTRVPGLPVAPARVDLRHPGENPLSRRYCVNRRGRHPAGRRCRSGLSRPPPPT